MASSHLKSRSLIVMMAFAGLSLAGCQTTPKVPVSQAPAPEPDMVETGPNYIPGLGYRLVWSKTDASVVSAPQAIKEEALALCQDKGYVRTFMRSLSFTTEEAVGYFDCTGGSSN